MTRFIHDQFAKQYLKELLTPLGNVETSRDIAGEVRQIDVFFAPKAEPDVEPTVLVQLGVNTQTIKQPRLYPYMST